MRGPASHGTCAVMEIGKVNDALWQPETDELDMEAAPARSTVKFVAFAGIEMLRPTWLTKLTPALATEHPLPPLTATDPEAVALTSLMATALGLFTLKMTSPTPPGKRLMLGVAGDEEIVSVWNVAALTLADDVPEPAAEK